MEFHIHEREGVRWFTCPLLDAETGPSHAFGALPAPGGPAPEPGALLHAIGREEALPLTLNQVHGAAVHHAETDEGFPRDGDGVVTSRPMLAPAVRTADCVPILLRSPETGAVAAIHAGWRGILEGVVEAGVRELQTAFGAEPDRLLAGVGPGIGACCYEVGEEVASRFEPNLLRPGYADRPHLDLWAAVRGRLEAAGLRRERISSARLCSACHPEWFPSYRRDGEAGNGVPSLVVPLP